MSILAFNASLGIEAVKARVVDVSTGDENKIERVSASGHTRRSAKGVPVWTL